jgi:putative flavoprotein involved in K+ transport
MPSLDTIVIGAGQAGLAMSRCLSERGVDHVVLERGRIADRWLTERWDSLRLLTPNWMSRLPRWSYDGADPDGFMTAVEVADYFARYARSSEAPVEEQSAVESLRFDGEVYELRTTGATWTAQRVVIATGWCDRPAIPAMALALPPDVRQIAPNSYRNPSSVPDGGVLVVGASATGVQLADELRSAGRDVVLAVGRHSRLPRRYRGMDIFWWLDRIGVRDKTIDEMPDAARARHEPSLQLVGGPDRRSVDLTTLQDAGVQIAGRVVGIDGHHVRFADDLGHTVTEADRRMRRVLAGIDRHIDETGLTDEVLAPEPMAPVRPAPSPDRLALNDRRIASVVWATGHRRTYPWLHVPVRDEYGEIRHRRGITPVPGLYVLGQHFQHARNSDSIDGVGRDAEFVADHLTCRTAITPRHH